MDDVDLPLSGIKVVEFTHMVMGPSAGVILADLGADVIKVEPEGGDQTRRLLGSGAGYFPMFNRNKRSICLDLKSEQGLAVARQLCGAADIVIGPGRVPEHVERPPLRAVRDQAAQREADLDRVDLALSRAGGGGAQDVEGELDDDPVMA